MSEVERLIANFKQSKDAAESSFGKPCLVCVMDRELYFGFYQAAYFWAFQRFPEDHIESTGFEFMGTWITPGGRTWEGMNFGLALPPKKELQKVFVPDDTGDIHSMKVEAEHEI